MITDFKLIDCNSSNYITLKRATYNQNGKAKIWDLTIVHDSVAILIFDKSSSEVVLVKQFRPPVYLRNSDGFTYELCAGILDKDKSEEQTAIEEIEEECGYRVSLNSLQRITSFYTSVGFAGSCQTLFFVEVDNSMKISDGGGVEDECIEIIRVNTRDLQTLIFDETKAKTSGLMFALNYFLEKQKRD